ncbi:T9SS type A sorting domain-containing protein [Mariniphaga sediminis]|uniref:T9SS type A sorting domain-containing protein n=1 Tax=Mariniphaga sediminis TaxID=1628158 RepID=UPI0035676DA4
MKTIFTRKQFIGGGLLLTSLLFVLLVQAQTKYVVEASNTVFTPDELSIQAGDTVEWRNVEGWHNVNGQQTTFPENPESFGNQEGNGWVYSHVFTTVGSYNYRCNPHASLGMTGKIEVRAANDDGKYTLTLNLSNMNPHVGQTLYLSVVDKSSGKEVERKMTTVSVAFSLQVSGIEKDHSYFVNFFADHNANGMYDAPPVDHSWQLEANNVSGNTTLDFTHNTNFIDINWQNKLTVNFAGMNPHVGQTLRLWVIDKSSGAEISYSGVMATAEFSVEVFGIENGKSYNIDFYADHNNNGTYDEPPVDHAWRLELNNVAGDAVLNFTHNTNFTNILPVTAVSDLVKRMFAMYPNPATGLVRLELTSSLSKPLVNIFDISGKMQLVQQSWKGATLDLDVSNLAEGMYFVTVSTREARETLKLIKQ